MQSSLLPSLATENLPALTSPATVRSFLCLYLARQVDRKAAQMIVEVAKAGVIQIDEATALLTYISGHTCKRHLSMRCAESPTFGIIGLRLLLPHYKNINN